MMYNSDSKIKCLESKYWIQLRAIFNNAETMEERYGDISGWLMPQYAEYCAQFRVLTRKNLSAFKTAIKSYLKIMNVEPDEINDLDLHLVQSKVQELHVGVFWTDLNDLYRCIRDTADNSKFDDERGYNVRETTIFSYNSVITTSILLFCGLDFDELTAIKRDEVLRNGIWSYDFPTRIPKQSRIAELIQNYARQDRQLREEEETGLPLVRGGKLGKQSLTKEVYRSILSKINNTSVTTFDYDFTAQNIVLSGEFFRIHEKYGGIENVDYEILRPVSRRDYVKINDVHELYALYQLYCMIVD